MQSRRKQTHFMPISYPLSAPFGLLIYHIFALIWIKDVTMAPTENVHCISMIYSVS